MLRRSVVAPTCSMREIATGSCTSGSTSSAATSSDGATPSSMGTVFSLSTQTWAPAGVMVLMATNAFARSWFWEFAFTDQELAGSANNIGSVPVPARSGNGA